MSEEFADQDLELEDVHKRVGGWFDSFVHSPQFEALTETQKPHASSVVRFFAEYSFRHVGMAPDQWDRRGVTECCLEVLPRKVTAKRAFFQAVAPVLSAFFNYLAEKELLSNARALAKTVAELDEEIIEASQDRRGWGMAKSFAMMAEDAGVDLSDEEALHQFMESYNEQILARQQQVPRAPFAPAASPPEPETSPSEPETYPTGPATPARRSGPKVGRNDPCPCGSGKKFKKCCGH